MKYRRHRWMPTQLQWGPFPVGTPKLCQSHDDCMKKGSGNFCAHYPNHYIDYGCCFDSDSETPKGFLKMPKPIAKYGLSLVQVRSPEGAVYSTSMPICSQNRVIPLMHSSHMNLPKLS
ncbi:hypothetical protein VNO77_00023 [Canavalia gladiata]|uniref:Albumin I chain a domain-containing protein n=1 Tax=Canavalia gladiata TaxID=3824 RepID=A0AAN9MTV8_CANGL